jgi:hypothetical protein
MVLTKTMIGTTIREMIGKIRKIGIVRILRKREIMGILGTKTIRIGTTIRMMIILSRREVVPGMMIRVDLGKALIRVERE